MKKLLMIFLIGTVFGSVYSQNKFGGQVFENKTKIGLPNIKVENLTTHVKEVSGNNGTFAIAAKIGDLISFSGFEYAPDTVLITNLKFITVSLELKQNMLKEVKVLTPEIKTGNLTAPPHRGPFDSRTVLYQTDAIGDNFGGIKILLNDWKKDENEKKKDLQLTSDEKVILNIQQVFSPQNLQNYLPLKGNELDNFIILYKPDVKAYKSSNFNLLLYLTTCYKNFIKIPAEKRQSEAFLQLTSNR